MARRIEDLTDEELRELLHDVGEKMRTFTPRQRQAVIAWAAAVLATRRLPERVRQRVVPSRPDCLGEK